MKVRKFLATNLLAIFLAGLMGLFLAGAIYLPIAGEYGVRVVLSLGVLSVLYGLESIYHLGHVNACTISFSAPECTNHNLEIPSLVIATIFYALWCWGTWDWKALGTPGKASNSAAPRKPNYVMAALLSGGGIVNRAGPRKPNYAMAALFCALLCGGWIVANPAALPAESYGSLICPVRLALVLMFGALLYSTTGKKNLGGQPQPLLTVVLSAALGFFVTGSIYQLKAWVAPLDSPVDALFSLLIEASTGGVQSMLNLSNAANAFVPALLLWAAIFAWKQWRLNKRGG
jgi:hypothetical protein